MKRTAHNKYQVKLLEPDLQKLKALIRKGVAQARTITRARILLAANAGKLDAEIYESFGVVRSTIHDARKHYVEGGLKRALYDASRTGKARKLTGVQEAEVIALACTTPPDGRSRWTLELLTEAVKNKLDVSIGTTAIWKICLRNDIKPWRKKMWVISKVTPAFKRNMLDVLAVYELPYNPLFPVICFDEISKQLLAEIREALPMSRGKVKRYDYEYERNGTVNLFVIIEPKGKKRYVFVTKHRKKKDFARVVKKLVTKIYKRAKKLIFVLDNLNTHNRQSLIEVFGEKEGKKIARKIEWHYTPKHGSWLNQAEIENHALSQQCLNRRIPTFQTIQHEVSCWVKDRNTKGVGINWQFTREKATEKFKLV